MLVADIFSMYFFSIFSSWVSFAHDGRGYKSAVINKIIVADGRHYTGNDRNLLSDKYLTSYYIVRYNFHGQYQTNYT